MRTWSFAMVTDYCQRSSLAQPRFLFWFPQSLLWAAPGLRDSAVFTVLLCFSTLGLQAPQLGACVLGEGRSVSAQRPRAGVRPTRELGIVFFCALRKETKQMGGGGEQRLPQQKSWIQVLPHNKATFGSPVITYAHCHIRGAGFWSHPRETGGRGCCGYRAGQDRRWEEHVPFVLRTQEDFKR